MSGQTRQNGYSGTSWLSVVVLALGLAGTVAAWYVIRNHEREQIRWATNLAADAIRIDLTTDIVWQVFGLDRLALLWDASGEPESLWTKNAELYLQHRPGCTAVEWFTPDGKQTKVVNATRPGRSRGQVGDLALKKWIEAAAEKKEPTVTAPLKTPDGTKQYAIVYPVYTDGQLRGYIVPFFDFEHSLGYVLDDMKPLGFSVELSQAGQDEFLLTGSSREYERDWATTTEVSVPGGVWQLRVWPNPGILDRIRSRVPEATLAVGTLLSLLLSVIVYLGVNAGHRSAHIERINKQLQLEVRTRTEAQHELAQAHGELERRVQERTAELAAANALLEQEMQEHKRTEESLRELTGRLFSLQDEERRRLARELHDGATQDLAALAMNLKMIRKDTRNTRACDTINESATLIDQCMAELRTISYLLHPPLFAELGLGPALRRYVEGFSARSGIEVTLEIDPRLDRLGHEAELSVFRVVQEALANVHRHSRSRTAKVFLGREDGTVTLEIRDDGRGISPELLHQIQAGTAGMGTSAMRERMRLLGGQLEITSDKAGTSVRALLPVSDVEQAKGHAA